MGYGWLALLTDYGRQDGFVAACHGVVARIAPAVRVIDITHDVPAHDIRHGAAVLAQTVAYLPPCVVVGVVDPGVGTRRRGVAVSAGEFVLVGPDNGLLGWAADALGGAEAVVSLEAEQFRLANSGSRTFDGRDVFAPAAAHLATGVRLGDLGPVLPDLVRLPSPRREVRAGAIDTEVLTVDHFGNAQLAAVAADLSAAKLGTQVRIELASGSRDLPLVAAFADVPEGRLAVLVDSSGHLAVVANQSSAASTLGIRSADAVFVRSV